MSSTDESAGESEEIILISKADLEKTERRFVAKNEAKKQKQFTTNLEEQLKEYKDKYEDNRKQFVQAVTKLLNAV